MYKNITIVNAHWNNRGDEAALFALLEKLKENYASSEITIIFKEGKSVEQFPEIENINYFAAKFKTEIWKMWLSVLTLGIWGFNEFLKKTIITLKKSDLIIYSPGGSVINDRFFWWKQMEYLVPFICAKIYRIPMFIAAPSIGPFETKKINSIRRWLLKTPKIMCVREEISQKYLADIDVKQNVHVTMDLAFMNVIDKTKNEVKLQQYIELNNYLKSYEKIVGITISDFKWHIKLNKDQDLLKRINSTFHQIIDDLGKKGYGVLFIPQLFGNENDTEYLSQFSTINTFMMSDNYDTFFQQYIISKLYAVIGLRYHSNIFAAKMGTPFISVVYEEKMEGFLKLANLLDYSFPLAEISIEKLEEKFALLETNHDQITQILKKGVIEWKKNADKTIELLKQYY